MANKAVILLIIFFFITGLALFAQGEKEISQSGDMVVYHHVDDQDVKGYFVHPDSKGPFPAVILIHEWWGYNESIKAYADAFAREGYAALAVDLYNGTSTDDPAKARELATSVSNNLEGAFANLKDAVAFLQNHKLINAKQIASVGWCFGGGWSYQMAINNLGTKVSVMYYGRFNVEDDFEQMRATILGHFAGEDRSIIVDDVKQLQVVLKQANENHAVFIYPNMQHGFARDLFTGKPTNEESKVAWERTLDFLEDQLLGLSCYQPQ